jgi:two-component sensor histidine kinase
MTEEEAVEKLRKQIAALSAFGGQSLRTHDLDCLLHEACELVSEAMGIELVKVLELLPDGETMLVRAGVNWKEGVVGHATFSAHANSPSGYALEEDAPIISRNIEDEDRFRIPELMTEHGVKSMVNVVIRGEHSAWGVLEVDARQPRDFDENDISFLQNYANLIASAIERLQTEAALREAVERSEILLGELNHRVRNMISNIRLLARRTVKTSGDLDAFAASFEARLAALGRTQDLLAAGTADAISLAETLRQELRAHGADTAERLSLAGPDVEVPAKTAQALGMAFHELATNAGKYGALAHDGARLEVSWQKLADRDKHDMFICWRERGVPIDQAPSRRGFGSETIERSLPYMLGGEAKLVFNPDGLECLIRFPLTSDEHGRAGKAGED